ncbi:MAG: hypothetical protein DSM107014_09310 [Gomphosphaeria aponina SAG 52.96 = DSM 107014]|uniref:Uncharacterized protein n=1 Tax=Gomphosphaeria aponina SAG 52.96 = DSM 107014 TaxID=1521640 RepID=A0A941GQM2_9CHRO|nr:hypothetical protein [Gomphosphaeria aponina SAG 52.96 = DSM 107014]
MTTTLNYHSAYHCPVCRQGKISSMPLMEAFACNFCQHIFTANLEQQLLKMADTQLPLIWRWNGKTWTRVLQEGMELGWGYGVAGIIFVILPTSIIGFGAYLFPPLPGTAFSWFPIFWTILAFFAHLACMGWLVIAYYQFPVFMYLSALRRRWI